MGVYQIAWLLVATLGLGIAMAKHGESQGNYNFWATLLGFGIELFLLIKGGFFA